MNFIFNLNAFSWKTLKPTAPLRDQFRVFAAESRTVSLGSHLAGPLRFGQNVTNQSSDSRAAHAQKALFPIAEK
jgi:hypothetical protein